MTRHYDTIVIGLGAAGVTAASTLAQAGKQVLGLEAQGRVGGRVHTVPFGDGVVELGAEWIHGESPSRVYDAALQKKIPVVFQNLTFNAFRSDGGKPEEDFQGFFNDVIVQAFALMEQAEQSMPLGEYVTKQLVPHLKEMHPEVAKDEDLTDQMLEFLNLLTNNYCATNDWNDLDSRDKYTPLDGHQHISWQKMGFKTFFEIMLNTLNEGPGFRTLEIQLNTEVSHISWPLESTGKVEVTTTNSGRYTCDNVIVTVSVGVLKESYKTLFTPKLPQQKAKAIETIAFGVMDKIILQFEQPWWPTNVTFFGFLWKGEDRRKVSREDYWTTRIFGASVPAGSNHALTLWTSGEVAKMVELLPEAEVINKCMKLLRMFMGANISIPQPVKMVRSTWYSNPFTRGSYTYDSIYAANYPTAREDLAAPLLDISGKPRVLFAGEATDQTHFSTVHGASDTGFREAMRLLPGSKI